MTLNLITLKYFCDAVKLGGVSAAAKANFVTQSAISQAIRKLEKDLGTQLVAHHPNRFRLTPEGQSAYSSALEILAKEASFRENFSSKNGALGNLDFACNYSFGLAVMPKLLQKFRTDYPDVKVNFFLGKTADIKQKLRDGTIDFAIAPDESDLEGFDQIEIYKGVFNLYVSEKIKPQQEKKLGYIIAECDCKDTIHFKNIYEKIHGSRPEISLQVGSWEAIASLTAAGLGIGYIPDYVGKNKSQLREYKHSYDLLHYRVCAFRPKGMKLRRSSEIFLSYF